MSPLKFLRQIKLLPLAAAVTSSPRRISGSGSFNHLYALTSPCGIKSQLHLPFPRYFDLLKLSRSAAKKLCISGQKLRYGSMVVFALIGSKNITLQSAYCTDDQHVLSYPRTRSLTASAIEENILGEFLLIWKLLVPIFLFLTVWLNWGQSHPVFLAVKVALIFLCTKPFPSSVHMFVEQLRHRIMSRHPPLLYRLNPSQVKLIEVEDYVFVCLARALVQDEKLVLIGILGGWWILPLSSRRELFLMNTTSWRELISLLKSRFRLEVVAEILINIFGLSQ